MLKFNQAKHSAVSFMYDFLKSGGAIGTINTGVFLPINCVVIWAGATTITNVASGGATTISIGRTDSALRYITTAAIGLFTTTNIVEGNPLATDADKVLGTGAANAAAQEITMDINAVAITAGKFIWTAVIIEYPAVAI